MINLQFSDADATHYNLLYEMLTAASGFRGAEHRIAGKIYEKLEALGQVVDKTGGMLYEYARPGFVQLEDAEHALLRRALDTVELNGRGTKLAAKLYEWLDRQST